MRFLHFIIIINIVNYNKVPIFFSYHCYMGTFHFLISKLEYQGLIFRFFIIKILMFLYRKTKLTYG